MNPRSQKLSRVVQLLGKPYARRLPAALAPMVLDVLEAAESPYTTSKLAKAHGTVFEDAMRVTRLMERAGFITLEPNPKDRRARLLVPSDKGLRFLALYDQL